MQDVCQPHGHGGWSMDELTELIWRSVFERARIHLNELKWPENNNMPFWQKPFWPPSSSNLHPLNFSMWAPLEGDGANESWEKNIRSNTPWNFCVNAATLSRSLTTATLCSVKIPKTFVAPVVLADDAATVEEWNHHLLLSRRNLFAFGGYWWALWELPTTLLLGFNRWERYDRFTHSDYGLQKSIALPELLLSQADGTLDMFTFWLHRKELWGHIAISLDSLRSSWKMLHSVWRNKRVAWLSGQFFYRHFRPQSLLSALSSLHLSTGKATTMCTTWVKPKRPAASPDREEVEKSPCSLSLMTEYRDPRVNWGWIGGRVIRRLQGFFI